MLLKLINIIEVQVRRVQISTVKARKPEYLSLKNISVTFVHIDQLLYLSTFNRIIKYTLKIQDKINACFSLPTNLTTIIVLLQRKASKDLFLKHEF